MTEDIVPITDFSQWEEYLNYCKVVDGQTLMNDRGVARMFGYTQTRRIIKSIKRYINELGSNGGMVLTNSRIPEFGGTKYTEYWLNYQAMITLLMHVGKTKEIIELRSQIPQMLEWFKAKLCQSLVPYNGTDIVQMINSHSDERWLKIQETLATAVSKLTDRHIEHEGRLDTIDGKLTAGFADLNDRMDKLEDRVGLKRVGPSGLDKQAHIQCIIEKFNGECPCCRLRKIVDESGNFIGHIDHYFRRNDNRFASIWPICAECNLGRNKTDRNRAHDQKMFDAYQEIACRYDPGNRRMPLLNGITWNPL